MERVKYSRSVWRCREDYEREKTKISADSLHDAAKLCISLSVVETAYRIIVAKSIPRRIWCVRELA